jgi:hypothetical protein
MGALTVFFDLAYLSYGPQQVARQQRADLDRRAHVDRIPEQLDCEVRRAGRVDELIANGTRTNWHEVRFIKERESQIDQALQSCV